mgnify:FL=1
MKPPVDRIIFEIGPFAVHWYGLLIVTGIMLGATVAAYLAKRDGENPDTIWDVLIVAVIFAVIGARIEYVVTQPHWGYYKNNLREALYLWQGGLRIYGAIIGGALGIAIFAWIRKKNPLRLTDYAAPGMALGHAIGRWGNFINNELYGPPTTLPWGLDIPRSHRLPPYHNLNEYPPSTRFHPAFLYESLLDLLLCGLLVWAFLRLRDRLKTGDITLGYIIGYSIIRYFMDYLRTDMTSAQTLALVLIGLSLIALLVRHQPWRRAEAPA